jgi:hypothetical protein
MRFYRILLRLYPKSFRDEYGDEMSSIFRIRLRDTDGSSRLRLFRRRSSRSFSTPRRFTPTSSARTCATRRGASGAPPDSLSPRSP